MFGECHAHIFMNGVDYRQAVKTHCSRPDEAVIRKHLQEYRRYGVAYEEMEGIITGPASWPGAWPGNMGSHIGARRLAYTKMVITEKLWGMAMIP